VRPAVENGLAEFARLDAGDEREPSFALEGENGTRLTYLAVSDAYRPATQVRDFHA
jgi:hypothetical protein